MTSQNERRFLATLDPALRAAVLRGGCHIRQGYLDTPAWKLLRVRLTTVSEHGGDSGRTTGMLTSKTGVGAERRVSMHEIDERHARWLLEHCSYRLEKRRLMVGVWKIDVYLGALDGLAVVEHPTDATAEPPKGVTLGAELTDAVNNYHLARLAGDLDGSVQAPAAVDRLYRMPGRIVFTGGPCSGKSTIIEELKASRGDRLHCVPEVATIVIVQVGAKPTADPQGMRVFNRSLYRAQQSFEDASLLQAAQDGKKGALFDRGECDIAPYVGGVGAFERICGTDIRYEYSRYDLVVCLQVPPRDVYERMKANNPARTETYEQASALGDGILAAWKGHPNFRYIPNGDGWESKRLAAIATVDAFLAAR